MGLAGVQCQRVMGARAAQTTENTAVSIGYPCITEFDGESGLTLQWLSLKLTRE